MRAHINAFVMLFFVCGHCVIVAQISPVLPDAIILDHQKKYLDGGSMEYITFYSQRGESGQIIPRHGILVKKPKAKATILVCHGFMCNKFDIGFLRRMLFPDYNVMMFDFRAHGEHIEPDHCCTFGRDEALDVAGAVSYVRSRDDIKDLPLIAYGFSMGAVAAIQAYADAFESSSGNTQPKQLFDALVLDCPYDKSENILRRCMDHLKITLFGYSFEIPGRKYLEKYAFNPYVQSFIKTILKTVAHMDATATNTYIYPISPSDSIKKITVPCFIIHCYNDEKVTVQAAHNLYDSAAGYTRLWITKGRHHFDSIFFNPDKYAYKINNFIKQVLSGDISKKKQQKKVVSDIKI
jgi:pimeloyl-ACP methyl ester carboxylesterase